MDRKVWTFWYGSYMNPAVLAEVDLRPDSFEVGRLDGFDIRIEPLANLVRSRFIASAMEPHPAQRAYIERILRPARDFAFPSWYVEKIERFLPEP
jgi:hypothetical protein